MERRNYKLLCTTKYRHEEKRKKMKDGIKERRKYNRERQDREKQSKKKERRNKGKKKGSLIKVRNEKVRIKKMDRMK